MLAILTTVLSANKHGAITLNAPVVDELLYGKVVPDEAMEEITGNRLEYSFVKYRYGMKINEANVVDSGHLITDFNL